jgi:hypothetical protein
VHEELGQLFPTARIAVLDRDTASSVQDYVEILRRVREREVDILVGTQMIAKGHDLPGVIFVGIVDSDVGLHIPDFRAAERSFQLLTQVAGRAGRRSEQGHVVLQTRVPSHPSLVLTASSKYYEFADTFLLYLNGKTQLFLQKYHHVGAVISWHLMYKYRVDMIWMATLLNSGVHTVMYSYYLGCLLKIKQVRLVKKYITTIQLCQFFILYSNFYLYHPPIETWFNYGIITFFATYGVGIVWLFSKFYYDSYVIKERLERLERIQYI